MTAGFVNSFLFLFWLAATGVGCLADDGGVFWALDGFSSTSSSSSSYWKKIAI